MGDGLRKTGIGVQCLVLLGCGRGVGVEGEGLRRWLGGEQSTGCRSEAIRVELICSQLTSVLLLIMRRAPCFALLAC
jgi:hypothetical protein